jgi:hypothetical protein
MFCLGWDLELYFRRGDERRGAVFVQPVLMSDDGTMSDPPMEMATR